MRRDRITITLNPKIIRSIDSLIDGKKIRNRSHGIEYVLDQYFNSSVSKAVIFAGGQGTKLRPFTYEMPKALLPINGKPLLEYMIESLKKNGIYDIIICTGYLGEKIEHHFGRGERYGVKITYSRESQPLKTGGILLKIKNLLEDKPFLVVHGDVLTDFDFEDLINFHKQQNSPATAALTSINKPVNLGQLKLHGTKLTNFYQKSVKNKIESHLVNCGIYVFEPGIFDYFPKGKKVFLLEDIIETMIRQKLVSGFVFEGKWFDVGTPDGYEDAIKNFK